MNNNLIKVTAPTGHSHNIEYVNPKFIVSTSRHHPDTGDRCNVMWSYCVDVRGFSYAVQMKLDELNIMVSYA